MDIRPCILSDRYDHQKQWEAYNLMETEQLTTK